MRWLDGIINSMDIEFEQTSGDMKGRETWHAAVHGAAKSQTRLSDNIQQFESDNSKVLIYPYPL